MSGTVISAPSHFICNSPRWPEGAVDPSAAPRMIDATDILSARILVVDDDADSAQVLAQTLALNGYTGVTVTCDSRVVPELHRRNDYDLILLDMHMPCMDGLDVMEGLKESERDGYLPVLALTAEPGHRMLALQRGARDFLRKPVDPDELLLRVRNQVEVRLLYKERALPVRA